MSYETCKKCGSFCNLSAHKCEEFEVSAEASIDYSAEEVSE